jgi:uncharacterized membrane protein YdbT with pleckstrin-like domain
MQIRKPKQQKEEENYEAVGLEVTEEPGSLKAELAKQMAELQRKMKILDEAEKPKEKMESLAQVEKYLQEIEETVKHMNFTGGDFDYIMQSLVEANTKLDEMKKQGNGDKQLKMLVVANIVVTLLAVVMVLIH